MHRISPNGVKSRLARHRQDKVKSDPRNQPKWMIRSEIRDISIFSDSPTIDELPSTAASPPALTRLECHTIEHTLNRLILEIVIIGNSNHRSEMRRGGVRYFLDDLLSKEWELLLWWKA